MPGRSSKVKGASRRKRRPTAALDLGASATLGQESWAGRWPALTGYAPPTQPLASSLVAGRECQARVDASVPAVEDPGDDESVASRSAMVSHIGATWGTSATTTTTASEDIRVDPQFRCVLPPQQHGPDLVRRCALLGGTRTSSVPPRLRMYGDSVGRECSDLRRQRRYTAGTRYPCLHEIELMYELPTEHSCQDVCLGSSSTSRGHDLLSEIKAENLGTQGGPRVLAHPRASGSGQPRTVTE